VDIPSGSGREGAVKYSDYALGRFIEAARSRAWFDDTLFVITADHGANARGTLQIPVQQYRIPLLFYSPAHVPAERIERLMSQIDVPPTILGRLRMSYRTKFFGRDIFRTPPGEERAFVGNYQALGYIRAGRLVTLAPHRLVRTTVLDAAAGGPSDAELRSEAIAWYQTASHAWRTGQYADDEANHVPAHAALARVENAAPPARLIQEFAVGGVIPAARGARRSID
jgi:arylsulfatase A-like enzyme